MICIKLQPLTILLTKTIAAQNEVALSYHKVRALYFLAVVFVRSIYEVSNMKFDSKSQYAYLYLSLVGAYYTMPRRINLFDHKYRKT